MAAVSLNIIRGTLFEFTCKLTDKHKNPTDLTGFTVRAFLRRHPYSRTSTELTVAMPSPATGTFTITLNPDETQLLKTGAYEFQAIATESDNEDVSAEVLRGQAFVKHSASFPEPYTS